MSRNLNSEMRKKLFSNFFSLSILRGFQFLIPLITLPYLIRTLGIDNFGLISFSMACALYAGAFIQFGFNITATREIARKKDDLAIVSKIFSVTFFSAIILSLFAILGFLIAIKVSGVKEIYYSIYIYSLVFVVFQSLFPSWLFQGLEKMGYIALFHSLSSVIYIIFLLLLINDPEDYYLVPFLNAIAAFAVLIISLFYIVNIVGLSIKAPSIDEIKLCLKNSFHAFTSQFAPNLYNNSSVFILGITSTPTQVGVFSAAMKITDAVISLGYIISNTFLPQLSTNINAHVIFRNIMLYSGAGLSVITFCFAEMISVKILSISSIQLIESIRVLSFSVAFVFIGLTFGQNYLMLINREALVKNITLSVSITFLMISLIAIPKFGLTGALFVLVGARASISVLLFICFIKLRKNHD